MRTRLNRAKRDLDAAREFVAHVEQNASAGISGTSALMRAALIEKAAESEYRHLLDLFAKDRTC